jgi:hypothetical protein
MTSKIDYAGMNILDVFDLNYDYLEDQEFNDLGLVLQAVRLADWIIGYPRRDGKQNSFLVPRPGCIARI